MTKSNEAAIEQMNEATALFMGWKWQVDEYYAHNTSDRLFEWSAYKPAQMKYHSSWDWLMPVIKKIRTMNVLALPGGASGWIKAAGKMNGALISIDLDKAHKGVFEFIQWYNSQTSTNE